MEPRAAEKDPACFVAASGKKGKTKGTGFRLVPFAVCSAAGVQRVSAAAHMVPPYRNVCSSL